MKPIIQFSCLIALVYLQSCGGGLIKHDATDSALRSPDPVLSSKVAVPDANNNLVVNDEKDIIGYWVGDFIPDAAGPYADKGNQEIWNYINKINISIDTIDGSLVKGHSVVAGNLRPFAGTMKKNGSTFEFSVKEPGDDKYDGVFKFSIAIGDAILSGGWEANQKITIPRRKYDLKKTLFHYAPNNNLEEGRFVDRAKKKSITYEGENGVNYTDTAFAMASDDIGKYNVSVQLLTTDEVANLSKADILILRNSIFARHGYSFKKRPLRMYFEQQPWYVPISDDVRTDITPLEQENLVLLVRYEKNAKEYYDTFGR
jgi:hypothetical protein